MFCEVCKISVSGPENFQQHLEGRSHLLQRRRLLAAVSTDPKSLPKEGIPCNVCSVSLSGLYEYQKHIKSVEHLEMQEKFYKQKYCDPVSSENDGHKMACADSSSAMDIDVEKDDFTRFSAQLKGSEPFRVCKPCGKEFSGPEPYKQHLVSKAHLKKCNNAAPGGIESSLLLDVGSPVLPTVFCCKICNIECPSAFNLQQHVNGAAHKKKIAAYHQSTMNPAAPSPGVPPTSWFCDICQVPCTGFDNYQQHLSGGPHLRNKLRAETRARNSSEICAGTSDMVASGIMEPDGGIRNAPLADGLSLDCGQKTVRDLLNEVVRDDHVDIENMKITCFRPDEEIIF